jgi:plasmid stabilization system protein ParE
MMRDIPFYPAARAEAVAAARYLESERAGYGEKFEAELDELCHRIAQFPRSGSHLGDYPSELDVRSYMLSRVRYPLIVATAGGGPMVYAVAHLHRRPGYWQDRLR